MNARLMMVAVKLAEMQEAIARHSYNPNSPGIFTLRVQFEELRQVYERWAEEAGPGR
jgi:hypothetical protein